ncbi:MAG: hypothetical protein ACO1QR_04665 [Chthoniobacteraceae bacterium]
MKITLTGILIFIALVVGFFLWIGGVPDTESTSHMARRGASRAWFQCGLLFVGGAATACFGDKEYGLFPPTSLRWLFIVLGVLVMLISGLWMQTMKEAWRSAKEMSFRHELVSTRHVHV